MGVGWNHRITKLAVCGGSETTKNGILGGLGTGGEVDAEEAQLCLQSVGHSRALRTVQCKRKKVFFHFFIFHFIIFQFSCAELLEFWSFSISFGGQFLGEIGLIGKSISIRESKWQQE